MVCIWWGGLTGKLGGLYTDFSAKNAAVSAFRVYGLVKGEVVKATPEGAGRGVVA
jgi:hypothetical protein